jgi:uncharacterized protein YutE (UPF0331/DUF86 family)
MIDKALVLRKFDELKEYLKQIREYTAITIEQYRNDWKIQRIVERTLQIMIESCADIAGHLISDKGYRTPKSYADTFRVLFENGIIGEDLYQTMEKMAKFRNIVVHNYDEVDAAIVVSILKKDLDDFAKFMDAVIRYLKKERTIP